MTHGDVGRRPDQPRVRAAGGAGRALDHRPRGAQLLGAGHRQHGDPGHVRHARAAGPVAAAAAGLPDPVGVRDDRAGGRQLRRPQHHLDHPPRRRRLRAQRPQVVHLRRPRPGLQADHLHGQVRPRRSDVPPAEHDPGARRRPGRRGAARPADVRLPGPARPRRGAVHRRAGPGHQHARRRGRRLRDRPGPARPGADALRDAGHRVRRAGPVDDVPPRGRPRGVRRPAGRPGRGPRVDRAQPHRDRPGPAAHPARRRG